MVAFLSFFKPLQMLIQRLLSLKSRAVDSLQHRAVLVASPVCAGYGQKFERWNLACRFHMGAGAQVLEIAVAIRGYCFVFGDAFYDLQFKRLV